MNDKSEWSKKKREALVEMRARFDGEGERRRALTTGEVATIKRFATVGDAMVEGVFWALAQPVIDGRCRIIEDDGRREREQRKVAEALAIAVCAYGAAGNANSYQPFGRWLYEGLGARQMPKEAIARRFRQLVAARTPDELAHRLRALLKLVAAPVDWATLTENLIQWASSDADRDETLRRWAQDFYGTFEATEGREGDGGSKRGDAKDKAKEAV